MRSILLASALFFAPIAASAGVVFEIETKDHETARTETMHAYAEGRNLKMEIAPGQDRAGPTHAPTIDQDHEDMIFHGDHRKEMIFVDHQDKTYMVMGENFSKDLKDDLEQSRNQSAGILAQAMGNMTPEQRQKIQAAMGQMGNARGNAGINPMVEQLRNQMKPKKVRVVKTSNKANKAGYPTIQYQIFEGQVLVEDVWATQAANLVGGKEMLSVFTKMAAFQEELGEEFGAERSSWMASITELDGRFPVVGHSYEDGELDEEWTLKSAKRRTLDPADFEPPSGYKRRSMGPY